MYTENCEITLQVCLKEFANKLERLRSNIALYLKEGDGQVRNNAGFVTHRCKERFLCIYKSVILGHLEYPGISGY